jgi:hypothetical protein
MAGLRIVGTVGAIAVDRARPEARYVARPDVAFPLRQRQAGDLLRSVLGKEAEVDLLRMGREDREMRAGTGLFRSEFRLEEIEFRK